MPWTITSQALCPWNSPGKSTGVGCHSLLQGIFLTQGSNLVVVMVLPIVHMEGQGRVWRLGGRKALSFNPVVTRLTKEPACVGGKGDSEILKSEELHHPNFPQASCWLLWCPCAAHMHIQTIGRPHSGWYFPFKKGEKPREPEIWGQV